MKTMRLTAYSLTNSNNYFTCEICGNALISVIFWCSAEKKYYCATCLIKELNKPESVISE